VSMPRSHKQILKRELVKPLLVAAEANTRSLAKDAHVLYDVGRHARAYALCTLCVEEFNKTLLLIGSLLATRNGEAFDWLTLTHMITKHEVKLMTHVLIMKHIEFEQTVVLQHLQSSLAAKFQEFVDIGIRLHRHKLKALYAGLWDGKVSEPSTFITPELAEISIKMVDGVVINILDAIRPHIVDLT
jgi:AbiV family abortive infection protein